MSTPITIHRTGPVLDAEGNPTYDDYGEPIVEAQAIPSVANRVTDTRSYEPVGNVLTLVTTTRASLPPTTANLALDNQDEITVPDRETRYKVTGIMKVERAIGTGLEHLIVDLKAVS